MNSDALTRERDARAEAYIAAVEALAADPGNRRSQARFTAALHALNFWGDRIPGAAETNSAAPEGSAAPLANTPAAAETAEAVAARILASDGIPGEGSKNADVDAVANRIAAA